MPCGYAFACIKFLLQKQFYLRLNLVGFLEDKTIFSLPLCKPCYLTPLQYVFIILKQEQPPLPVLKINIIVEFPGLREYWLHYKQIIFYSVW